MDFCDSLEEKKEKKISSRNSISNLTRYEEEFSFH